MHYEPRWACVGLDDIFGFRASVFEAGGNMLDDGFGEDFVKLGGLDFLVASLVDFGGEFEELGDIMPSSGAGDEDGGVGEKVEITFELVKDMIGVVDEVGFSEDDDDTFAGVDDLTGEGLVEFGMRLGGINEKAANVGLLDSGEGAQGGEFFDTYFPFAGLAQASGIKNFQCLTMEFDFDTIDVAGGALTGADEGLLLLT